MKRKTIMILSQVFVPDPASVGQHIADVAFELAARGHRVIVYCSARGHENPRVKYPKRETIRNVIVRRFSLGSFGKKSMLLRVAGTAMFMVQCLRVGLFTRRVDLLFFSTSPPLIGIVASILHLLRRFPIAYWAMDLNPDQLIALGKISARGPIARLLEGANRLILKESSLIFTLDRFMADRLEARFPLRQKIVVAPPWPHVDQIGSETAGQVSKNPFRESHGLSGRFVLMYSGNHSPSNPLTTILEAAIRLRDVPNLIFVFVGGGTGKQEVERYIRDYALSNAVSLPYQPLEALKDSLSAADVHIVSLGEQMVGIIHPCKIYGAMAVGRPILYLGPHPSHISDIIDRHAVGFRIVHGDVDGAVSAIRQLMAIDVEKLRQMGIDAQAVLRRELSQTILCGKLCDRLEQILFAEGKDSGAACAGNK